MSDSLSVKPAQIRFESKQLIESNSEHATQVRERRR